jgi:5'-deoxynucleotidase
MRKFILLILAIFAYVTRGGLGMFHFFAYISRLRLIKRWSLMRNTYEENTQEHSWQVAVVAHALAVIKNRLYGGNLDENRVAVLSLYHDVSETVTGDLPTPVKYANGEIERVFHALEDAAVDELAEKLPEELQADFRSVLLPEKTPEEELVHIADKICAYLKCAEELSCGNQEFKVAYEATARKLEAYADRPEVAYFMEKFVPSFSLTLDELKK